jgi:hypothetical protein
MVFSEEKLLRNVFPQTPFQKIFLENLFEKRFSNFPKTFWKNNFTVLRGKYLSRLLEVLEVRKLLSRSFWWGQGATPLVTSLQR